MILSIIIFLLVLGAIRRFIWFIFMPPMPHHHMWFNDSFMHGPHGPFGGPHGPMGPGPRF